MSDPNLRRWLGWSHVGTVGEIASYSKKPSVPRHLFLARQNTNEDLERTRDLGLQHLGLEVVTIENWGAFGEAIRNLIAV